MLSRQTVIEESPPAAAAFDDDQHLVNRAKKDPAVFSELYEKHADRVYRYLLSRVGNVPDAQDLTSQTFLTALENMHKFRGDGVFAAWLLSIARHKAMDHFRRQRPQGDMEMAEYIASDDDDPDDVISRKLQTEMITRKLETISPDRAEAIRLRLFGGLAAAEIAKAMDKNEPAVRMLIHRGLQDLQQQLNFTLEDVL